MTPLHKPILGEYFPINHALRKLTLADFKSKHRHQLFVLRILFIGFILCAGSLSTVAWTPAMAALPGAGGTSTDLSAGATGPAEQKANETSCDQTCDGIAYNSTGGIAGIGAGGAPSTSVWGPTDDLICAHLGSPTAAGSSRKAPPAHEGSPSCTGITISDTVFAVTNSCEEASSIRNRCARRNTQLELHCLAFSSLRSDSQARVAESVLIGLDATAAAVCIGACAVTGTGPGALAGQAFCSLAAGTAGAFELLQALALVEDGSGEILNTSPLANISSRTTEGGINADDQRTIGVTLGGAGAGTAVTNFVETIARKASGNAATKRSASACAAAGIFSGLVGVRAYNLAMFDSNRDATCKAINDLTSQGGPGGPGSSGSSSATGGTGSDSAFDTNSGGISPAAQIQNAIDQCVQGNCSAIGPTGSTALDGGILANKQLPPNAAQVIPDAQQFFDTLKKEGAGAALSSLPVPGAAALGEIADSAQERGAELAGIAGINPIAPVNTAYAQAGGGSGASGGGAGFGGMFGGQRGNSMGPKSAATQVFNASKNKMDIWHTGIQDNIFQIISKKIEKVGTRVAKPKMPRQRR